MYGKTRITLSNKEIRYLNLAIKQEVDRKKGMKKIMGKQWYQEDIDALEKLLEKLEKADERSFFITDRLPRR